MAEFPEPTAPSQRARSSVPNWVVGVLLLGWMATLVFTAILYAEVKRGAKAAGVAFMDEKIPKSVRDYGDGWKRYRFESLGIEIDLPEKPYSIEADYTGNERSYTQGYFIYQCDRFRVTGYRYRYAAERTFEELKEHHSQLYADDPDYRHLRFQVKRVDVQGWAASQGFAAGQVKGEPVVIGLFDIAPPGYEFQFEVYGETREEVKPIFDRMARSLKLEAS